MVDGILIVFATVAVCMDLNRERIDNRLIALGWILGFSYQLIQEGLRGIGIFFAGAAIPILLLYLLFYFRMIGAGDIKLLSVLGGFMGPAASAICVGVSLVFGAILSLAILILCGNLVSRLRYFTDYFTRLVTTKEVVPYMVSGRRMENLHFSIPILMGILLFAGGYY